MVINKVYVLLWAITSKDPWSGEPAHDQLNTVHATLESAKKYAPVGLTWSVVLINTWGATENPDTFKHTYRHWRIVEKEVKNFS